MALAVIAPRRTLPYLGLSHQMVDLYTSNGMNAQGGRPEYALRDIPVSNICAHNVTNLYFVHISLTHKIHLSIFIHIAPHIFELSYSKRVTTL